MCGGIVGDIAADLGLTTTGPPELMAPTMDGGVEAKVPTHAGDLAVQCKAYSNFGNEVVSVQESFATFLTRPEHSRVATYIWCSQARRTSGVGAGAGAKTGNEAKADKAITDMLAAAKAAGRTVHVAIRFADDLNRIIRERRPEYLAVMGGLAPLGLEEIRRYSTRRADDILARLGGEEEPQLEFPSPETAGFLDRLLVSSVPPNRIEVDGVARQLDEVVARADWIWPDDLGDRIADDVTGLRAEAEVVQASVSDARKIMASLKALHASVRSALNSALNVLRESKGSGGEASRVAYCRALLVLQERVDLLCCEAGAVNAGAVLVTGRWGTGKSHQLARHTKRALAAGTPVLLLRARDFTSADQPILAQPWRGHFDNRLAEPAEFAALLDAIGHRAGRPLVIVVDGLNEAAIRDPAAAMERLQETLARFPNVRLVVSSRRDRLISGVATIPELVHKAPERVTMSRALQGALNAPPGTRWHAALTNPLLASVAARLLSSRPDGAGVPMSRSDLFDAWVDLLSAETAAALDQPHKTIERVIAGIAAGTDTVIDLAASTRLPSNSVDAIVGHLADEGLLETEGDRVRFRWEALSESLRARRAIQDDRLDEFLSEVDDDRRLELLDLVAETMPKVRPGTELPGLALRLANGAERDRAFAASLIVRADDDVHRATLLHARRLMGQPGDLSQLIVLAVLSLPDRRRLGTAWLADWLRDTPRRKRSRVWPSALELLCERSQNDQRAMQDLLGWHAVESWPRLTADQVDPTIDALAWVACANVRTNLPDVAIRALAEILHRHPSRLADALSRLARLDDDRPRHAVVAAAEGATARWPGSSLPSPGPVGADPFDGQVDPTVPLTFKFHRSDVVEPSAWWAITTMPKNASSLRVTDPDGVDWVVLEGAFRMLEPNCESSPPVLLLGRGRWALDGDDDGRPQGGSRRHEFVRVTGAALTGPIRANTADDASPDRFASAFGERGDGRTLVAYSLTSNPSQPTGVLLELLGATWTGWGLDCVDVDGRLVITDPSVPAGGPPAVLVRRDALGAALSRHGRRITVDVSLRDNLRTWPSVIASSLTLG